jgi:2,4-dienoyl-CoA reductase (NADPH2)
VHEGHSPTLDLEEWMREWGVTDPAATRGGVVPPQVTPPAREVFLLQRKETGGRKGLGKTTGWIHRAALRKKRVEMVPGVNYERIDEHGLHVSFGERRGTRAASTSTASCCAPGQEPQRELAASLEAAACAPT